MAENTSQTSANEIAGKRDTCCISIDDLLEKNREWAESKTDLFKKLALKQEPKILWIGCSDSRVPAEEVLQLGPGDIFVHRNIANVVSHSDLSCQSVIQYAVEVLKVEHIIVCGHYGCGGVEAALGNQQLGLIDNWLRLIKDVYNINHDELAKEPSARFQKLVELNATNSARAVCHTSVVQDAWKKGQKLTVHAWVFDIGTGLAKPLQNDHDKYWAISNAEENIFRYGQSKP